MSCTFYRIRSHIFSVPLFDLYYSTIFSTVNRRVLTFTNFSHLSYLRHIIGIIQRYEYEKSPTYAGLICDVITLQLRP